MNTRIEKNSQTAKYALQNGILSPPPLGEGWVGDTLYKIYPPHLKKFAQDMRKNPTDAEKKFWSIIKNKQTGYKFRRQQAINSQYIADFICFELRLIIEIDGSQHCDNVNDTQRTLKMETEGFRIVRFWNNEVLQNLEGCYEILMQHINFSVSLLSPT